MKNLEELYKIALDASIEAGKEILEVYAQDFDVEIKADNSPLTIADKRSNARIVSFLEETGIPVLSEEGKEIGYEERVNWDYFWMVDPLDGTKEFIKRNGEFTVNIALIQGKKPVFGVIYVPVRNELYFGGSDTNSYKILEITEMLSSYDAYCSSAVKLPIEREEDNYVMIGSRSHMSEETQAYFDKVRAEKGEVEVFSAGSSLKLCYVAEGKADEYPRFAPTMEWDTAAGQAIIEGAGKNVIHYKSGELMYYNKENLLNGWFIAKQL